MPACTHRNNSVQIVLAINVARLHCSARLIPGTTSPPIHHLSITSQLRRHFRHFTNTSPPRQHLAAISTPSLRNLITATSPLRYRFTTTSLSLHHHFPTSSSQISHHFAITCHFTNSPLRHLFTTFPQLRPTSPPPPLHNRFTTLSSLHHHFATTSSPRRHFTTSLPICFST